MEKKTTPDTNIDQKITKLEISAKVKPSRLQKLLRAGLFRIIVTIILMLLIFTTAFAIAYQLGTKEEATSAYQLNIIPEATIIIKK